MLHILDMEETVQIKVSVRKQPETFQIEKKILYAIIYVFVIILDLCETNQPLMQ